MAAEDNAPQVVVLSEFIDRVTVEDRAANAWGTPRSTYASKLDECMRQLWYSRKGFKEQSVSKPEWLRNAETGTDMHRRYQDKLRRAGLTVKAKEVLQHAGLTEKDFFPWQWRRMPEWAEEMPIPKNPVTEIGGKGDNVVRLTMEKTFEISGGKDDQPLTRKVTFEDELVVVELKTLKPEHWRAVNRSTSVKWKSFYSQIQLYLHFYKIKRAILAAICRGCDEVKEFLIEYDPGYVAGRLDKARRLKRHLDENTVPTAEGLAEGPYGSMCRFCPFKDLCSIEEMGLT